MLPADSCVQAQVAACIRSSLGTPKAKDVPCRVTGLSAHNSCDLLCFGHIPGLHTTRKIELGRCSKRKARASRSLYDQRPCHPA